MNSRRFIRSSSQLEDAGRSVSRFDCARYDYCGRITARPLCVGHSRPTAAVSPCRSASQANRRQPLVILTDWGGASFRPSGGQHVACASEKRPSPLRPGDGFFVGSVDHLGQVERAKRRRIAQQRLSTAPARRSGEMLWLGCASPWRSGRRCRRPPPAPCQRFYRAEDFSTSLSPEHCARLRERPLSPAWSHFGHPRLGRYRWPPIQVDCSTAAGLAALGGCVGRRPSAGA